jgi:hypothetical protein
MKHLAEVRARFLAERFGVRAHLPQVSQNNVVGFLCHLTKL